MKSLLTVPVQLAEPHALPFRVIFEEHRRRHPVLLVEKASRILGIAPSEPDTGDPDRGDPDYEPLAAALLRQETAYAALSRTNQAINDGTYSSTGPSVDDLLGECQLAEAPLKQILHLLNASALCLSGGGIRSASFSLGVVEGLARFSRACPEAPDDRLDNRLLDKLDYLSTVSGGGYTGSWLMSWVYRRMAAARPFPEVAESFSLAEGKLRIALAICRQTAESVQIAAAATDKRFKESVAILIWACAQARDSIDVAKQNASATAAKDATYATILDRAMDAGGAMNQTNALLKNTDSIDQKIAPVTVLVEQALQALKSARPADWKSAYADVISALAGKQPVTSGDPEPSPIFHLRAYTSFLAPTLGFSLDTFTLAAIVLRNLFVNWAALIPVMLCAVAFFETTASGLILAQRWIPYNCGFGLTLFILFLFLLAVAIAAFALPSHRQAKLSLLLRPSSVPVFLIAVICGAALLTVSWGPGRPLPNVAPIAFLSFAILSFSIFLSFRARAAKTFSISAGVLAKAALAASVATLVIGELTSWLIVGLQNQVLPLLLEAPKRQPGWMLLHATDDRLYVIFALPLFLTLILLMTSLFCALLGLFELEEDREWWARCGGCILLFNLVWIVANAVALYGRGAGHRLWVGVAGLLLGGLSSAIGFSGSTAASAHSLKPSQLSGFGKFLQKHGLILPGASAIALILIVIGATSIEETLRRMLRAAMPVHALTGHLRSAALILAIFFVLSLLVNWAININLFSLHGMYRMRLMRAFLGASNVFRNPNSFTGFDPKDTPQEVDLPCACGAPLHVINCTLNLVGTKNTAWRQRKAECFSFTPLVAGCWRLGYVPSSIYGGVRGVTLATAMSISGAAFNPNMGYQSSPMLSLLMTFFNVRLGCWLPNPANPLNVKQASFYSKSSPSFALGPLIREAFGKTDDTSSWIELSDGGHFENLALYEMVMRRCKNIIIVDAGADPKYQYEDLGNAIRKISIDLGIPIDFDVELPMKPGLDKNNLYCAVATIHYECVDPALPQSAVPLEREECLTGTLVYIKAALTNDVPPDVFQYAKTHDSFPNETTANQFFSESQFESYRHLGSHAVDNIAKKFFDAPTTSTIETFIDAAKAYGAPSAPHSTSAPPQS